MILLITGNGKGKTTAAIGHGVRVVGNSKRVLMLQFLKSKSWPTGEEEAIKKFGKQFELIKGGKGFVGIMGDKLPFVVHKKAAEETLNKAKKAIFSKKYNLIILDEVNVALSLKLIKIKDVLALIKKLPKDTDLILTGRYAPKELIKVSDIMTECREIKHPYNKGVQGKKGREY